MTRVISSNRAQSENIFLQDAFVEIEIISYPYDFISNSAITFAVKDYYFCGVKAFSYTALEFLLTILICFKIAKNIEFLIY